MLLNIAQNMLFSKYIAVLDNRITEFIVTIYKPGTDGRDHRGCES